MYLKLLSLAAFTGVSAAETSNRNLRHHHGFPLDSSSSHRDLQLGGSIACIVGDPSAQGLISCCAAAEPSDPVCTLLTGVNLPEIELNPGFNCGQIETACGGVVLFAAVVPGLQALCTQVDTCCDADTDTAGWNGCMKQAVTDGDITPPDFGSLIPGFGAGEPATTDPPPTVETTEVPVTLPEPVTTAPPPTGETTEATPAAIVTAVGPGVSINATQAPADGTTGTTVAPGQPEPGPVGTTDSIACILTGKTVEECCAIADPSDVICTLFMCVGLTDLALNDMCSCGQIETACPVVESFDAIVPGIKDMCAEVDKCCVDDTTVNDDFDMCMTKSIEDGTITVPDFAAIMGGIPGAGATTPSTPAATTTITPTVPSGGDPNGSTGSNAGAASTHGVETLMYLIGASLAMIFV